MAFLDKVETSVKVLRTMLKVKNLRLGVESANELLKQIQIKMNKELLKRIREIFEEKISKKTGWGKNELMIEYDKAVNEALVELLESKH